MQRRHVLLVLVTLVGGGITATGCMQERVPADLEIRAFTGGIPTWNGPSESVHLSANGRGEWSRSDDLGRVASPTDSGRFEIPSEGVANVWRAVHSNHFFRLAPSYLRRRIADGGYLRLWIVANGDTHTVRVRNDYVPRIRRIYEAINLVTPREATLHYEDIGQSLPWWMRLLC
jgi:hypothetical protein